MACNIYMHLFNKYLLNACYILARHWDATFNHKEILSLSGLYSSRENILTLWLPKITYTYDKYSEVEMHSAMREYNKGIQPGSRESEKASQRK